MASIQQKVIDNDKLRAFVDEHGGADARCAADWEKRNVFLECVPARENLAHRFVSALQFV